MTDTPEIKAGRRHRASDEAVMKAMRDDWRGMAAKMSDYFKALGFEDADGDGEVTPAEAAAQMGEGDEPPAVKALDYAAIAEAVEDAVLEALDDIAGADAEAPMAQAIEAVLGDAPGEDEEDDEPYVLVYDKYAVLCLGAADWRVPYRIEAGAVVLDTPDAWQRVEKEWKPVPGAASITAGEVKALSDDLIAYTGDEVKALGDGWVGGLLIRYADPATDPGDHSEMRDLFVAETDFGGATKSAAYLHHRLLPGLGKRQFQHDAELQYTDVGVFAKLLLNLRDAYEAKMYELASAGKLGWSSGSAPHLVERKALGDGRHIILKWPLGLDASLTPTPAGGLDMTAKALKALAEIDDSPEATDATDHEGPTGREVGDDAARRLALELDLLTLETAS